MDSDLKILILEDNHIDAELIERELRSNNIEFSSMRVDTEPEFVKALDDFSPELVLADYNLPSYTGLEALQHMKKNSVNVPLIIVTGSLNEETAVNCIKEGAADYIIKEHLMRLPSAIESAMDKQNITNEKMLAMETLTQQYQFLQEILESITHPFLVIDAKDHTIKMANPAAKETLRINGEIVTYGQICSREASGTGANVDFLREVEQKKKATVIEQAYTFDDVVKNFEVHSYPIFDQNNCVTQIITYLIDITDRKRAEQRIRKSLQEKETLLKEIFHRVKNNLQVISSLIKLQGHQLKDNEEIYGMFKKSQDRIQAMALIHEKLYQSQDMTQIDFVKYTRDLVNHLFSSYGIIPGSVKLKISIKDVYMDINTAIPCGLIINELISNSLKHAFPGGRTGEISITIFTYENRAFNLIVTDNGIGFPEETDFTHVKSLGLQLVTTLVQQMGGQITHEVKNGTTFRIVFTPPKKKYTGNFVTSSS